MAKLVLKVKEISKFKRMGRKKVNKIIKRKRNG